MRKQFSIVRAGSACHLFTAASMLAISLIFSCSSDDGGGNPEPPLRKEKISGVSQKGPFAQGSAVNIYELNASTGEKGEPLFNTTTDGSGNFKIQNVTLASQYIVIEVNGYYLNEVSGVQTTDPITLRAVADVSGKDNVNINVFTHLEYDKVLKLAKSGMEFGAAKKEAQREVLNALGMSEAGVNSSEDLSLFGGSRSDSLLLATSFLLQANRSPTQVESLLAAIGGEIRDNGALSGQTKTQVASGLASLGENSNVGRGVLDLVNNIVARMNSSSSSGGGASSSSVDESKDPYASCKDGLGRSYFCEWGTPPNTSSNPGCFAISRDPAHLACDDLIYDCINWGYLYVNSTEVAGGTCDGIRIAGEYTEGSCNASDYGAVVIGTQTWMAKNYGCYAPGSKCHNDNPADCAAYGRLYNWETAITVCPSGWHLPNDADWNKLIDFVGRETAGTKLKATSGWYLYSGSGWPVAGTDDFGFSALPGGYGTRALYGLSDPHFYGGGTRGDWWSASESDPSKAAPEYYASSLYMTSYEEVVRSNNSSSKTDFLSVRCLQN